MLRREGEEIVNISMALEKNLNFVRVDKYKGACMVIPVGIAYIRGDTSGYHGVLFCSGQIVKDGRAHLTI